MIPLALLDGVCRVVRDVVRMPALESWIRRTVAARGDIRHPARIP